MKGKICSFFIVLFFVIFASTFYNCKKKVKEAEEKVKVERIAEKRALLEPSFATFTPDIFLYGGIKSLDSLIGEVVKIVGKVSLEMSASLPLLITSGLTNNVFGVKNLDFLDTTKNIRFINANPKKYADGICLIVPLKNKDSLILSLPEDKVENKENNLYQYKVKGEPIYVNFIKEFAVFTKDPKIFSDVKNFIENTVLKYEIKDFLNIQLSVKGAREIFKDEIDAFAKKIDEQPLPSQPKVPIPLQGVEKILKEEISLLTSVLEQIDVANWTINIKDETIKLVTKAKVVPQKGISQFLAAEKERKIELYKALPSNSWIAMAGSLQSKYFKKWSNLGVDFIAELLKLTLEEKTKLSEMMDKTYELETGDFAFSIASSEKFPFIIVSLTGVKDGAKYREIVYNTYSMLFSKARNFLLKEVLASQGEEAKMLLAFKTDNFKVFIDSLKPALKKEGIEISLKQESEKGLYFDTIEAKFDWTKGIFKNDPEVETIKSIIGDKVSLSIAFSKDKVVFVFGEDSHRDTKNILEGKTKESLTTKNIEKLLKQSELPVIITGYFSTVEFFKSFKDIIPNLRDKAVQIEQMKSSEGISLTLGGKENVIELLIEVPLSEIIEVVKLSAPQPSVPTP